MWKLSGYKILWSVIKYLVYQELSISSTVASGIIISFASISSYITSVNKKTIGNQEWIDWYHYWINEPKNTVIALKFIWNISFPVFPKLPFWSKTFYDWVLCQKFKPTDCETEMIFKFWFVVPTILGTELSRQGFLVGRKPWNRFEFVKQALSS